MADVVVLYKFEDLPRAHMIARGLEAAGFHTWWDRQLLHGDDYEQEIRNRLHEAKAVVLVATKKALASEYLLREARLAYATNKLVIVSIEDVQLPPDLNPLQRYDLSEWTEHLERDARWASFTARIAHLAGNPNHPSAPALSDKTGHGPTGAAVGAILGPLGGIVGAVLGGVVGAGILLGKPASPSEPEAAEQDTSPTAQPERITLSSFSPKTIRPATEFLVQAFVHKPSETEEVRRAAKDRDPSALRGGSQALGVMARTGDTIRLSLQADGLKIEEPVQELLWFGQYVGIAFLVRVPRWRWKQQYALRISVEVNGVPAGRLKFLLSVDPRASRTAAVEPVLGYEPYQYVFMSYASDDREMVLQQSSTLKALGIPHFLDVDALRAGDQWEEKLREHVNRADMFMLFWSTAAAKSCWVEKEALWALGCQRQSPTAEPEIKPYRLGANGPPPPRALRHLHFEAR